MKKVNSMLLSLALFSRMAGYSQDAVTRWSLIVNTKEKYAEHLALDWICVTGHADMLEGACRCLTAVHWRLKTDSECATSPMHDSSGLNILPESYKSHVLCSLCKAGPPNNTRGALSVEFFTRWPGVRGWPLTPECLHAPVHRGHSD